MNALLAIPMEARLAGVFLLGTLLGSLANLGIYRLAWHPRPIGPWAAPDPAVPRRRLGDRLPIIGWLGLRRESALHGPGFWIRPLLVELAMGLGLAALYWWEIGRLGLLPPDVPRPVPAGPMLMLHVQYACHVALVWLMVVASAIDVDEKTIPDAVTVPGTLLGLALAAVYPWSLLPSLTVPAGRALTENLWQVVGPDSWPFLQLVSPQAWPASLDGFPHGWSLAIGLACWWFWCVALMPRTWHSQRGWRRAFGLCVARLARQGVTYWILGMGAAGSLAIGAAWLRGGLGWTGLLSALVGVAGGGGLIWLVRVIGTAVLHREAMGFGDVTLLAMIGAFLGWQTCLVIFFLAPFAALGVGVVQWIVSRDNEIPYGPFLCLAAVAAIVHWAAIWDRVWSAFALGWIVPVIVLACMAVMGLLLGMWQLARTVFR